MRVYLSGPMTGFPDLNHPAFHAEAARLRAIGYTVTSPAEVNPDHSMSWEQCLRADIKALCDCDAIALMPGWENSKGAHLELHIAHRVGMKVMLSASILAGWPACMTHSRRPDRMGSREYERREKPVRAAGWMGDTGGTPFGPVDSDGGHLD